MKTITAEEFDELFDSGGEITPYIIPGSARRINEEPQRVNVDFPRWVVMALDRESRRLGVTRQALVKIWIAERLEKV
jgi:hypothetical protein